MENRDTESQALTVLSRQDLTARSPMEALAAMSDAEFRARLDALKKAQTRMATIQREMMQEGIDYGIIPGTGDKPTLLKPGSEILCKSNHLVPTFHFHNRYGDGVNEPTIQVEAICNLHAEDSTGPIVGQGVGACNSWEKKYRWRAAQRACPQCGAAAIIKGKAEWGGGWVCYKAKGGCGAKFKDGDTSIEQQQLGQVENPDPYDMENTIKKMAAKRSQIDATLRVTATSGLFTQDLEDLVPEPVKKPEAPKAARKPQATAVTEDEPPDDDYAPSEDVPPPPTSQTAPRYRAPQRYWERWYELCAEAKRAGLKPPELREDATKEEITEAGGKLKQAIEIAAKLPV